LRTPSIIILIAVSLPVLQAGEDAVLTSGSRLHADRHESDGARVRLYIGDGFVEMSATVIDHFEQDDAPIPPPPAPIAAATPPPAAPALEPVPSEPAALAHFTARKYSLPPEFVASVMETESAMHPNAVSPKGAIGLMQLMPATARTLGVDPHDPIQNTDGGVRYLRDLLARFEPFPDQVILALAAYNAGPEAVDHYHGVPPYAETRSYIWRVINNWERRKAASRTQ
jgi:soluble lytic murein transglycosylase-like protein